MKILVLGAGNIGGKVVEDLVNSGVDEVIIADIDVHKAEVIAEKYSGKGGIVKPRYIDVNNYDELVRLMDSVDVVANSVGPFKRFGPRILEAAIDANTDIVDICDDPEPTIEELNLHDKARDMGITAVIGLGNNPGVGNLCAKYGAAKLDNVEEIKFIWVHPAFEDGGIASTEHAIHVFSGNIITYKNGEWIEIQAGTEAEEVLFPSPIGRIKVVHTGHPEPITIPRYIKGVKNVSCKGSIYPQWAAEEFMKLLSYGFGSEEAIEIDGVSIEPRKFFVAFLRKFSKKMASYGGEVAKASRVIVKGGNTTLVYDRIGFEWNASIPLSIGVQLLANKKIKVKGVYPPEGVIDPRTFFEGLKRRGLKIIEREIIEQEI